MNNILKSVLLLSGRRVCCAALMVLMSGSSSVVVASDEKPAPKIESSTQPFSLKLMQSRVIVDPESNGTSLRIHNEQSYPMLVQSSALNEDMKTKAPFMITPPLFRLDANQQTRLRIVRTGGKYPDDRETLHWLCVKGIPPKAEDSWAEGKNGKTKTPDKISLNVQLAVNNCIKLLVRPKSVQGQPSESAASITWQRLDKVLKAENPTPFYMNLGSLKVNGKDTEMLHYLPPFSSYDFKLPSGSADKVQWTVLDDHGGISKPFEAVLK